MKGNPLHTGLCDELGIEVPIFGFSHCKDVIVELCNAGGVGIFGATGHEPHELEEDIKWIRERIGDKPFGVDMIFAATLPQTCVTWGDLDKAIPEEHRQFVRAI